MPLEEYVEPGPTSGPAHRAHRIAEISRNRVRSDVLWNGFADEMDYEGELDTFADLSYTVGFIDIPMEYTRTRWIPEEPREPNGSSNTVVQAGSTGTFQILFESAGNTRPVRIGIAGLIDPFGDNRRSDGEVTLYAVFDSRARTAADTHFLYIAPGSGLLTYELSHGGEIYATTTHFLITNGDARFYPGDDVVLDFQTHARPRRRLSEEMADRDVERFMGFFAVYDKRLLDRANLYIDEGSRDVNEGAQPDIHPFTWHNMTPNDPSDDYSIFGAVAYSVSAQDSVEEFNLKMEQQRLLQEAADRHPLLSETIADTDATTAPRGDWVRYTKASDVERVLQGLPQYGYNPSLTVLDGIGGFEGLRPYVPGYSSARDEWGFVDRWYYAGQSAGTDCIGFMQRVITEVYRSGGTNRPYTAVRPLGAHWWSWTDGAYTAPVVDDDGYPYHVPQNREDDGPPGGNARHYVENRRSFHVKGDGVGTATLDEVARYDDPSFLNRLARVVPGDVFYYRSQAGYHSAFVLNVEYEEDIAARTPLPAAVKLIHATYNTEYRVGSVTKHDRIDLRYYDSDFKQNWTIGRLIRD